jgi:hypothetical protein
MARTKQSARRSLSSVKKVSTEKKVKMAALEPSSKKRKWEAESSAALSCSSDVAVTVQIGTDIIADVPDHLLRTFSRLFKDMPAGTTTWDLGGFIIDGSVLKPVVVRCWLDIISKAANPWIEYDAYNVDWRVACIIFDVWYDVMMFADAVKSTSAVFDKMCCDDDQEILHEMRFPITPISDDEKYKTIEVSLDFDYEWDGLTLASVEDIWFNDMIADDLLNPVVPDEAAKVTMARSLAAQLKKLLLLYYTVPYLKDTGLKTLCGKVHNFIVNQYNVVSSGFLAAVPITEIFDDELFEAALTADKDFIKKLWMQGVLNDV